MTVSDIQGHNIIQRQITRKRYKIELFQWRTNRKSYLSNGVIFSDLERPLHPVSRSHHSLTLKYIRNGTRYRHSFNEIGLLIGTCVLHNSEWFSKTFNDTKHRAVSLRELSILLSRGSTLTILI